MPSVIVQAGDCLSSIAARFGFGWRVVWDAPENAALRKLRRDPNVLMPGDVVVVPENELRRETAATGARHVFELDVEPAFVRIRFLFADTPRPNLRWTLAEGPQRSGWTDAEGFMEARVDPRTTETRLTLHPEDAPTEEYALRLGWLDPVDSVTGLQQRLSNLGFDPGPVDGVVGERTRAATRRFQSRHGATVDGISGPETRRLLLQVHGG